MRRLLSVLSLSTLSLLGLVLGSCQLLPQPAPAGPAFLEPAWGVPPPDLLEKAAWEYSLDGGKTFAARPDQNIPEGRTFRVAARARFQCDHPEDLKALELTQKPGLRSAGNVKINGQTPRGPFPGMTYKDIPSLSPGLLRGGINELTLDCDLKSPPRSQPALAAPSLALLGLESSHVLFRSGPVLGQFNGQAFTVTCRTNMQAEVAVCSRQADGNGGRELVLARSSMGLIHRIEVEIPPQDAFPREYYVRAQVGRHAIRERIDPPLQPVGEMRFVACGDSRTQPLRWAEVAAAAARHDPVLVLHTGDMVSSGKEENAWWPEFFAPAKALFATTPLYPVIGNHENNAPLYNEFFHTPSADGRARNWSQAVGGVLFIGIDGLQDWSLDSANVAWLVSVLEASKEKFIFLVTHYPPASSSGHGAQDKNGQLREKTMRYAREVIVPILEEYGATAIVAGHDHCYERSEMPSGLTVLTTGGGGAPLYAQIKDVRTQNPWSRAFAMKYHYCLFEVKGDTCTMTALTPKGEILDSRTWTGRAVNGSR